MCIRDSSNADEVELFLNDKSLGKKAMPRNSHLRWDVAYMPGKLTAVGNKKDKLIYAVQETTGTPAEVVMTPYKTTMMADGKDVSVINISVIDREGRTIPVSYTHLDVYKRQGQGKQAHQLGSVRWVSSKLKPRVFRHPNRVAVV